MNFPTRLLPNSGFSTFKSQHPREQPGSGKRFHGNGMRVTTPGNGIAAWICPGVGSAGTRGQAPCHPGVAPPGIPDGIGAWMGRLPPGSGMERANPRDPWLREFSEIVPGFQDVARSSQPLACASLAPEQIPAGLRPFPFAIPGFSRREFAAGISLESSRRAQIDGIRSRNLRPCHLCFPFLHSPPRARTEPGISARNPLHPGKSCPLQPRDLGREELWNVLGTPGDGDSHLG